MFSHLLCTSLQIVQKSICECSAQSFGPPANVIQVWSRSFAARKGTREKRLKIQRKIKAQRLEKEKKEAAKAELLSKRVKTSNEPLRFRDRHLPDAVDDVYYLCHFKEKVWNLEEAIQAHRDLHHPTMYNVPNALLIARIELDLSLDKKNTFVDEWSDVVYLPHYFEHSSKRRVLVLCNNKDLQARAVDVGASYSGGSELVKQFQKGQIAAADFDFIVAHVDMVQDLHPLRGLLKRSKFPSIAKGTLSDNVEYMVRRFVEGLDYQVAVHAVAADYGWIERPIGMLSMDLGMLDDNFRAVIENVLSKKPAEKKTKMVTRVLMKTLHSPEKLRIDHAKYCADDEIEEDSDEE